MQLLLPTCDGPPACTDTHRDTMVFEAERDIKAFIGCCRAANIPIHNCLLALDGSAYNLRPVRHNDMTSALCCTASA